MISEFPSSDTTTSFDLAAYARMNRYRMRNLHDGRPVPPAIQKGPCDKTRGYWGQDDRCDAIVGHHGYVAMDGDTLSIFLFYKSAKGVNRALSQLEAMDARIDQEGDMEVCATVSVEQIEEALKLIKVSKLRPGDVSRFRPHTERVLGTESIGASSAVG